jgi:integrase
MRDLSLDLDFKETVRPHDLRRTHGTMITSLGFTRDQMNRIQNHKDGGIASVYDRHSYAHEARVIQEAVADQIERLIPPSGELVAGMR